MVSNTHDDKTRPIMSAPIDITSDFCGGAITVLSTTDTHCKLKLKAEPFTQHTDKKSHKQWFSFKASNVKGKEVTFEIVDAGEASFSPAWQGYTVVGSYDDETWFRVANTYFTRCLDENENKYSRKDGVLRWTVTATQDTIAFAYFIQFTLARQKAMVDRAVATKLATVQSLTKTIDGRETQMIECGSGPKNVWITARQHPGAWHCRWMCGR